jgi:hypothetical protein
MAADGPSPSLSDMDAARGTTGPASLPKHPPSYLQAKAVRLQHFRGLRHYR